jgi:hypothetical protein
LLFAGEAFCWRYSNELGALSFSDVWESGMLEKHTSYLCVNPRLWDSSRQQHLTWFVFFELKNESVSC